MACNQHPPTPTVVNFFKIICEWNLRDEKIALPLKFTHKFEGVLPNPIILKVPSGIEWRVHWNKHDGKVWLERGWKEIVQHYSLAHGHLLMFKYEVASSHFEVLIFDKSTLEIDHYPLCLTTDDNAPNLQSLHVDVKVEDDQHEGTKFGNKITVDGSLGQQVEEDKGKRTSGRSKIPKPKKKTPSFELHMWRSYVKGRCIAVPEEFRKYLKEGPVCLKVLGVGTWYTRFKIWKGVTGQIKYKLQSGWSKFRRENNLQVGDVCVFELTNSSKVTTLTVRISRAASTAHN